MKSLRIPEHKINNAYLLVGEELPVLEEAAAVFASSLLLRGTDGDRQESARLRLRSGTHPDLLRITPDKPEENPHIISVENIRRSVTETVGIRPYEAEYKLYLISEAEKMNAQAQNALLKTLEEPPEYVVIVLLSRNAEAFLPTILSRVIELRAAEREPRERFLEFYREEWAKETVALLSELRFRTMGDILDFIKRRNEEKTDTTALYSFIEIILRDVLCYKSARRESLLYGQEIRKEISGLARELSYERLGVATEELSRAMRGIAVNVNRDLQLENLLIRMKEA